MFDSAFYPFEADEVSIGGSWVLVILNNQSPCGGSAVLPYVNFKGACFFIFLISLKIRQA